MQWRTLNLFLIFQMRHGKIGFITIVPPFFLNNYPIMRIAIYKHVFEIYSCLLFHIWKTFNDVSYFQMRHDKLGFITIVTHYFIYIQSCDI